MIAQTTPQYTQTGQGYDGVVAILVKTDSGNVRGTGVLLNDGHTILTAAHLFDNMNTFGQTRIFFDLPEQEGYMVTPSSYTLHPDYDPVNCNNDLCLIDLGEQAPVSADRYDIYRDNDEIGQEAVLVGYGKTGTGEEGASIRTDQKTMATNIFDTETQDLDEHITWKPNVAQLAADFDDGEAVHDAFGMLLGITNEVTDLEGLPAQGDSGGPAFIDGKIAGICSYTATTEADSNETEDNSFGEFASWQRVSSAQEWIDTTVRSWYENAPTSASEVVKEIQEGDDGISFAYFLVEFSGLRDQDVVSVDYATRDGTAVAGEDYLAVSGHLNLYADEDYAVIPVEVKSDTVAEGDETFYLDIFNPDGGSFSDGAVKLTAMRTIVDDDGMA